MLKDPDFSFQNNSLSFFLIVEEKTTGKHTSFSSKSSQT